jgi:hypothetical protein
VCGARLERVVSSQRASRLHCMQGGARKRCSGTQGGVQARLEPPPRH